MSSPRDSRPRTVELDTFSDHGDEDPFSPDGNFLGNRPNPFAKLAFQQDFGESSNGMWTNSRPRNDDFFSHRGPYSDDPNSTLRSGYPPERPEMNGHSDSLLFDQSPEGPADTFPRRDRYPDSNRNDTNAHHYNNSGSGIHQNAHRTEQSNRRRGGAHGTHTMPNYNNRFSSQSPPRAPATFLIDPAERARWKWSNIQNLDAFLAEVYTYFHERGIWSITLGRILNLFTVGFVVAFSTYLTMCIDYSLLPRSKSLNDIYIQKCFHKMPFSLHFLLWLFSVMWVFHLFHYIFDLRRLWDMHDFFHYLLEIPDSDIQTVPWDRVVEGLMKLRDERSSAAFNGLPETSHSRSKPAVRLDKAAISNRLMRRDNYMIALIHQEIIDLKVNVPVIGETQVFTKTLEWLLGFAILDFVFDPQGQVRPQFLYKNNQNHLVQQLRDRIRLVGVASFFCVPVLLVFSVLSYFFRYFVEFRSNPGELGKRAYTPMAHWMFREYNELWHELELRKSSSYPFANAYLAQFPKDKYTKLCRFVEFVSGAFAAVLVIASLLDPDLFLGFEITHNRTVLFYIGVLTAIYATARSAAAEDKVAFYPVFPLTRAMAHLRYDPPAWKGRLHTDAVHKEFAALYQLQILLFLQELLSIIVAPFILIFLLPHSLKRVIVFFREHTIYIDGLGYVSSYAVEGLGQDRDYKSSSKSKAKQKKKVTISDSVHQPAKWKRAADRIQVDEGRNNGESSSSAAAQSMMMSYNTGQSAGPTDSQFFAHLSESQGPKGVYSPDPELGNRYVHTEELGKLQARDHGPSLLKLAQGRQELYDLPVSHDQPGRDEGDGSQHDEDQDDEESEVDPAWNESLGEGLNSSVRDLHFGRSQTEPQTVSTLFRQIIQRTTRPDRWGI